MASPRERTNGPTPISLYLSLANWSISPNSQSRFRSHRVLPTNFQPDFQRDSWRNFLNISRALYIYSSIHKFWISKRKLGIRNLEQGLIDDLEKKEEEGERTTRSKRSGRLRRRRPMLTRPSVALLLAAVKSGRR